MGSDLVDEVHPCCDQRVHLALALKQILGQRPVPVEPADMARQKVERLPPPLQKRAAIITAAAYSHIGLSIQRFSQCMALQRVQLHHLQLTRSSSPKYSFIWETSCLHTATVPVDIAHGNIICYHRVTGRMTGCSTGMLPRPGCT